MPPGRTSAAHDLNQIGGYAEKNFNCEKLLLNTLRMREIEATLFTRIDALDDNGIAPYQIYTAMLVSAQKTDADSTSIGLHGRFETLSQTLVDDYRILDGVRPDAQLGDKVIVIDDAGYANILVSHRLIMQEAWDIAENEKNMDLFGGMVRGFYIHVLKETNAALKVYPGISEEIYSIRRDMLDNILRLNQMENPWVTIPIETVDAIKVVLTDTDNFTDEEIGTVIDIYEAMARTESRTDVKTKVYDVGELVAKSVQEGEYRDAVEKLRTKLKTSIDKD